MYGGERPDARALDELEALVRAVAEELAASRARALRAEGERGPGGAAGGRLDPELRGRLAELEAENKGLRQRVEAARGRVNELLGRLTFLEEQTRETGNGRGGAGGGR